VTHQAKAARGCSDYGFHMAVTSWSDKVATDMEELTKLGALDGWVWVWFGLVGWMSFGLGGR